MRGVGPLPPPGLEDAELSGDLEHPLQQALLRAAGQKTISKLAEDTKAKARVGQLEAEQVLPVDPRPDRLSGLPITQALAELHQRDQGQAPGRTGWLTLLGIEVGEVAIHEDRPERIAQGEIGAAFGKGGASDAGGLFGHRRDRLLRVERHGEASRDHLTNAALDPPSHTFANGIGPKMGQFWWGSPQTRSASNIHPGPPNGADQAHPGNRPVVERNSAGYPNFCNFSGAATRATRLNADLCMPCSGMAHASCVALQPVEVDTGTTDRDGFLVFVDNALVAVLVRLEDKEHGAMRGQ